eukprot:scaffold359_cov313-Prasinococcus_capsulatus_cf.AAC.8
MSVLFACLMATNCADRARAKPADLWVAGDAGDAGDVRRRGGVGAGVRRAGGAAEGQWRRDCRGAVLPVRGQHGGAGAPVGGGRPLGSCGHATAAGGGGARCDPHARGRGGARPLCSVRGAGGALRGAAG